MIEFRERRLDYEEVILEIQKGIDDLKKTMDRLKQREKQIVKEALQAEVRGSVCVHMHIYMCVVGVWSCVCVGAVLGVCVGILFNMVVSERLRVTEGVLSNKDIALPLQ